MRIGIVGGGVYGAATAYFLEHFGADEVILFEKGNISGGSTGYSAGIVRQYYTHEVQIRMARRGLEILSNLPDYIGQDGGFHRNGYLKLPDPDRETQFQDTVELQRRLGIDVNVVNAEEIVAALPGMDANDVNVGVLEHESGFADPYLVTTGFANAAQALGTEILTGTRVTEIGTEDGAVTSITADGERFPVDCVVNAAGPWGHEVGQMVGLDLPLQRHESKIAVLESETPYRTEYPTLSDHSMEPDMYTKPEPGGKFLVGGIDRPPVDPETGLEGVTTDFLQSVGDRIDRRLPGYADAEVADTWSGVITVTPDGVQIAGEPEELSGLFNAVGGSGHGFKEAPAFAESLAQTILGEPPKVKLAPFCLERFRESNSFSGISTETYGGS